VKKGRGVEVPNYKNDLLINVIEAILPDGAMQWQLVATRHKEVSGEAELRDCHDLKRHFTTSKSLCDNGKKVTGLAARKKVVARISGVVYCRSHLHPTAVVPTVTTKRQILMKKQKFMYNTKKMQTMRNIMVLHLLDHSTIRSSMMTQFEEEDDENNEVS
jgi:hypothetical protein